MAGIEPATNHVSFLSGIPLRCGGGTAKAIAGTAEFLKEQKRVPAVLGDYSPYVSADFVRQAEQVQVGQR